MIKEIWWQTLLRSYLPTDCLTYWSMLSLLNRWWKEIKHHKYQKSQILIVFSFMSHYSQRICRTLLLSLIWNQGSTPAATLGNKHRKHLLKEMNMLHSANLLGI